MMTIPYEQLSADTLDGLIEEYVTRDGTDYGTIELSLEAKVQRVKEQLKQKKVVIVFDEIQESVNIIAQEELKQFESKDH